MEFKDYYGILGVTSDADDKTIKSAYRKLARQYHPDVSSDQDAERKFKEVSEAYQALKDPEKRAEYDRLRQYQSGGGFTPPPGWRGFQGGGQSGFEDEEAFSDFFQSIFGAGFGPDPGPRPGRDVEVELPLFLEDTVADTGKRIRVGERTLNVTIPAGTGDNERIRLKGQGAPGIDGGPTGDLYLRVRLAPHPLFDLDGRDLIITLPITPWEAALGAKIPLPTLTGRIQVTIPANSQNGRRLRLKGQGLRGEPPGDLYAVLKVVMPERADERTQALWRELAEHSDFNPRAGWADQE